MNTEHPAEIQEAAVPLESRDLVNEIDKPADVKKTDAGEKLSRFEKKLSDRREVKPEALQKETEEKAAKSEKRDPEKLAAIAKHEAKVREGQKALEVAAAELARDREHVEAVATRAQQIVDGMSIAVADPVRFYEDVLGLKSPSELEEVAKLLYYKAAGLKAPADVQAKTGVHSLQREVEVLRRQQAEMARRLEDKSEQHNQELLAREYSRDTEHFVGQLSKGVDGLEYLSAEAEADPKAVWKAIHEEAANMVEEEELDETPDPQEVAERIEKRLRAYYEKRQPRFSKMWGVKAKEEVGGSGRQKMKASPAVSERDLSTPNERRGPPKDERERMQRALDRVRENLASRGR